MIAITGAATHFGRLGIKKRNDVVIGEALALHAIVVNSIPKPKV
jgi:hypothetical protein